jgi:hypothetical protein
MIALRFLLAAALLAASVQLAGASSLPTNVTTLTYDPGHGSQVEYVAANGTNFLWYPGNAVVLPGHWKLRRAAGVKATQICFVYGPNTWNPVTGVVGAQWECEATSFYIALTVERAKGDVFGLAHRRTVPFVLSRGRASLADLLRRMGPTVSPVPATPRR